jgi:hypothetical protein
MRHSNDGDGLPFHHGFGIVTGISFVLIFLLFLGMAGCPQYNVYKSTKSGEAELRHAESSRQIAVESAKAKLASAEHLSQAEVVRAGGVAEANAIIGDSLKGNEAYLRYLYIENLNEGDCERIYVPTEAGLPILEATRG